MRTRLTNLMVSFVFTATLLLASGCQHTPLSADSAKAEDSSFTIAMLPDPQNYLSCDHQKADGFPFDASEQFMEQMHYIAKDIGHKMPPLDALGDGWLRPLKCEMAAAAPTIAFKTYSTYYKKFSSEVPDYAKWYRPHEQPDMTDAEFLAAEDFVIKLSDFRQRFGKIGQVK